MDKSCKTGDKGRRNWKGKKTRRRERRSTSDNKGNFEMQTYWRFESETATDPASRVVPFSNVCLFVWVWNRRSTISTVLYVPSAACYFWTCVKNFSNQNLSSVSQTMNQWTIGIFVNFLILDRLGKCHTIPHATRYIAQSMANDFTRSTVIRWLINARLGNGWTMSWEKMRSELGITAPDPQ